MKDRELHIHIRINYPKGIGRVWRKKFGTKGKPRYDKKCKLCGMTAGEHFYPDYRCPK